MYTSHTTYTTHTLNKSHAAHAYIQKYIHTYIHTYIHCITLHYIAVHYITLHTSIYTNIHKTYIHAYVHACTNVKLVKRTCSSCTKGLVSRPCRSVNMATMVHMNAICSVILTSWPPPGINPCADTTICSRILCRGTVEPRGLLGERQNDQQ